MTRIQRKQRPARRVLRRAAVIALLAGDPVCSSCDGWGTDRVDGNADCPACAGQGVSASVRALFAPYAGGVDCRA